MEGTERGMRVAIVGVGGTGCALLPLLGVRKGVHITLIDGDTVEEANLSRQPLYGPLDVGRAKVEVAAERMQHLLAYGNVGMEARFLDSANARSILEGHDLVADCTDDLHARLLIDRVCGELGIPLVAGAVHGCQVQVATLRTVDPRQGTVIGMSDLFAGRIGSGQDGCDMRQVPAYVTAIAAAVMAGHISALCEGDRSLAGVLELIDMRTGRWMRMKPPVAPVDEELIAVTAWHVGSV